MAKEDNVLTEDFLFELYYACFTYDYVCNLVCEYMQNHICQVGISKPYMGIYANISQSINQLQLLTSLVRLFL